METGIPGQEANFLRIIYYMSSVAQKVLSWVFFIDCKDRMANENFQDYLLRQGWTQANVNTAFNATQQTIIKNDPSCKSFDISLLALIFRKAGREVKGGNDPAWRCPGSLEGQIKSIKDIRNNVFHGPARLTDSQMSDQISQCKGLVKDLIQSVQERYDLELDRINDFSQQIEKEMVKIVSAPLSKTQLMCSMEQFFETVICEGLDELIECYREWSRINPVFFLDGWCCEIEVDSVFTDMVIIDSGRQLKEGEQIECSQILSATNNNIVLLEGQAGAGKSTFIKYLLSKWIDRESTVVERLRDFDIVILFECRNRSIGTLEGLVSFLFTNTLQKFHSVDTLKCILNLNVLFLIDGLDEMNDTSRHVVRQIMDTSSKPNVTMLCTSRPSYIETFYKLIPTGSKTRHIRLDGIPRHSYALFVERLHRNICFSIEPKISADESIRSLVDYITSSSDDLKTHFAYPLNLTLVTILWIISPNQIHNVSTITALYLQLLKMVNEKLCERLQKRAKCEHLMSDVLKDAIECCYKELCKYALQDLKKKTFILSKQSLRSMKKFCSSLTVDEEKVSLPVEEVVGAYLSAKHTWTSFSSDIQYSYPHRSLQEYMSAEQLCGSLVEGIASMEDIAGFLDAPYYEQDTATSKTFHKYLDQLNIFLHMAGILQYLGDDLLHCHGPSLVKYIGSRLKPDLNWWLRFLLETGDDPHICEVVAEFVPDDKWLIKDGSLNVCTQLLEYTRPESFEVVLSNAFNEPQLVKLVERLSQQKCSLNIEINYSFLNLFSSNENRVTELLASGRGELTRLCVHLTCPSVIRELPKTLKSLFISISSEAALTALLDWTHLGNLSHLTVHIKEHVSLAVMKPLPDCPRVSLFLSGLTDDNMDWVIKAALLLQPADGYDLIMGQGTPSYSPRTGLKMKGGDGITKEGKLQFRTLVCKAIAGDIQLENIGSKNISLKLPLFWSIYSCHLEADHDEQISSTTGDEFLKLIFCASKTSSPNIFPMERRSRLLRNDFD